jgi:hypothetical protein
MDISLSGIRLDLDGEESAVDVAPAGLEFRGPFEIELRLGDAHARLRADLCRREGPHLALFFRDTLRGGRLDPPADLAQIVGELEQRAVRLRGAAPGPAPGAVDPSLSA